MAVINKNGNSMGLPLNIARGNPIPLDASDLWYSLEELQTYAKENPIAYVGQILGYVDETAGTATAYIILNTAGDIQEIGSGVTQGDNTSVEINLLGAITLKNWGVKYWAYNETNGQYTEQLVDETHPWLSGLEPRVGESLVLEWYQPDLSLNKLIDTKADKSDTYTKTEVNTVIANAAHLKRVIVDSIDNIETLEENTIYLVSKTAEDNDSYDEYMAINGQLEKVGSWKVDLSNYVTIETLEQDLSSKVDKQENYSLISNELITKLKNIDSGAEQNLINAVSEEFSVVDRTLGLVAVPTSKVSGLTEALSTKVDKQYTENEDGTKTEWQLLSPTDKEKIDALALNKGNLVITAAQVTDLNTWVTNNRDTVPGLFSTTAEKALSDLESSTVKLIDFNTVVGNLQYMKDNNINVLDSIEALQTKTQWQDLI